TRLPPSVAQGSRQLARSIVWRALLCPWGAPIGEPEPEGVPLAEPISFRGEGALAPSTSRPLPAGRRRGLVIQFIGRSQVILVRTTACRKISLPCPLHVSVQHCPQSPSSRSRPWLVT